MPKTVPTPVAAAIGIVPAVVDTVRALPGKAVQLPILAVSSALTALESVRREYDDLADRGEKLVSRLRGTSYDDFEDKFEDVLQGTPLATPYDVVEDAAEDVVAKVSDLLDRAAHRAPAASRPEAALKAAPAAPKAAPAAPKAAPAAPKAVPTAPKAADPEAPKGEPTPSAPTETVERVETAATPEVVEAVEAVATATIAPEVTDHADLPLPDYDHMTLGALRGRLRSLSVTELVQVRDYEKAHAARLPVVTLLDNRIAKLASDEAADGAGTAAATKAPAKKTPAKRPATSGNGNGKVDQPASAKKAPARTKVRTT